MNEAIWRKMYNRENYREDESMNFALRREIAIDPGKVCFSKRESEDEGKVVYRASILVYTEMFVDADMDEFVIEEAIKGMLVRRLTDEVMDSMVQC